MRCFLPNRQWVYIRPLPLERFSHPPPDSTPLVVTERWAERPVLHSSLSGAICSTRSSVYVSMLLSICLPAPPRGAPSLEPGAPDIPCCLASGRPSLSALPTSLFCKTLPSGVDHFLLTPWVGCCALPLPSCSALLFFPHYLSQIVFVYSGVGALNSLRAGDHVLMYLFPQAWFRTWPMVDTILSSLVCVKAALRGWWRCLFRWWVPITESVLGRSWEGAITQKFLFCLAFSYIHVVSFFFNWNFHLLFIFGS